MSKREISILFIRIMALLMMLRGVQMLIFSAGSLITWFSSGGGGPGLQLYFLQVVPYVVFAFVLWFGAEKLASLICLGGDLDANAVSFASSREISALAFALFGLYTISFALPYFLMNLASLAEALFDPFSGRMWLPEAAGAVGHFVLIALGAYLLFNSGSFVRLMEVRKSISNKE